jgi:hypothetical protein
MKNDLISRQAAIDNLKRHLNGTDVPDSYPGIFNAIEEWLSDWEVPSAQSKQLKVLADVLDGCPLTQPCYKLWKTEGWCKEHCKPGQQEPDAECWLKYAEVMAADDT